MPCKIFVAHILGLARARLLCRFGGFSVLNLDERPQMSENHMFLLPVNKLVVW